MNKDTIPDGMINEARPEPLREEMQRAMHRIGDSVHHNQRELARLQVLFDMLPLGMTDKQEDAIRFLVLTKL